MTVTLICSNLNLILQMMPGSKLSDQKVPFIDRAFLTALPVYFFTGKTVRNTLLTKNNSDPNVYC